MKIAVATTINGQREEFAVTPHQTLLEFLRDDLKLKGAVERKWLTKADEKKFKSGYERATEILKNAGAREIFKTWRLASHPGGTVKIGECVDADLKTEYDNLYVCDCSVIPEPWGLPPTLTLLGLARKLSKHLLDQGR